MNTNETTRRIVAEMLDGQHRRVTLSERTRITERRSEYCGAGIDLLGIWIVRGHAIMGIYSRWDDGRGACQGASYREMDECELDGAIRRLPGCEALLEFVPAL